MSIFLFLLLILSLTAIGVMYFLNNKTKVESEKKIKDLEVTLVEIKEELAKSIKISEQRQKNNQDQIYAGQIVSQIKQGVICIDENQIIQLINPYGEQFLSTANVIGKPYQEGLTFKVDGVKDYSFFESALKGKDQIVSGNAELVTQHGNIPIIGTISLIKADDGKQSIVFIFSDNSDGLAKIQEEKAFFSAAAHELKTPLTAIRLSVLLLLQQLDTLGKEKIIEYLKGANDSIDYLVKLVNDFLNVSRIDQGRLAIDKKSFDMVALTDEIIKEVSLLVRERKLYLNHKLVEGKYRNVVGDPVKSKEILTNLISNGVKYTSQGGVTITHQVTNTSLITKVTDSGYGIPVESQALLFKRFSQIGTARTQTTAKSTGLGLYISKKMAQLMQGDVLLESSEPGKGSTFSFIMPLVTK